MRISKLTIRLALACVLLQALIPAGYMPASLASGNFVQFCPSGLPASVVTAILGEHHHHHHADDINFERCSALCATPVALVGDDSAHAVSMPPASAGTPIESVTALYVPIASIYRSRAPPWPGNA